MILQPVLGGAMVCSAETHAAVRTGVCVILSTDPANVDWAGPGLAATQVTLQAADTTENKPNGNLFMGNGERQQTTKPLQKTLEGGVVYLLPSTNKVICLEIRNQTK